ncbi:DNA oxidative demethylase AlkB [Herminiimonas fonticola]|uniref:Alpha-ketoglutarate-dependent dioxygenase AlkB n=1 Tax=Herminiimonas fonticola TaxID=303380 RepID=A0A4V3BV95_9BURK|nr:DNA oxidative demethylase AlkB [Herminiimonas fonticola]RBA24338.1 Alkylated DNA repair protein [Herminiimonas fonticola]TDN90338.1 alkylated DNA repair protein (DNA oxidative demethylase) [Herminiimonas fonticola]
MTLSLFDDEESRRTWQEPLCEGAVVLRGFALDDETRILAALKKILAQSPLRHMVTPGGFRMSVAMSNCGTYGWVTDRSAYRYDRIDPENGNAWPAMPGFFAELAQKAAAQAGFKDFMPDACLINRYEVGARMSLHQDKNERDFTQPIVSVSLGIPAVFLFGGMQRADKAMRVPLAHGDVVVWGGPARLRYHGVSALKPASHSLLGECRINLTFRKVS